MNDTLTDLLMDAGFYPAEDAETTPAHVAQTDCLAWRQDGDMLDLVSVDDTTVILTRSTLNLVIHAQARFDMTTTGFAWIAAAVNA
jgi:hypothetical protein